MIPATTPWAMLKVNGMTRIVSMAGRASEISSQRIFTTDPAMSTPTTTSAGAVAKTGIDWIRGVRKRARRKQNATTTLARPVRAPAAMPEALLAQFANAVTAIFAFDNELGGYRTFRTTGPSFLNDLETIHPFDVFFVLTERSTSLAIPEFLLPAG